MGRKKSQKRLREQQYEDHQQHNENNKIIESDISNKKVNHVDSQLESSSFTPSFASRNDDDVGNCYNQLMQLGLGQVKPTNWLNGMYTISRKIHVSIDSRQQQQPIKKRKNDDIDNLIQELNSIKHSLWPAAVQASNLKNKKFRQKKQTKKPIKQKQKHKHKTSSSKEFHLAREKCNPFEELSTKPWIEGYTKSFVCRSAMKLANIDSILDFKLTATNDDDNDLIPFKFVDLCGAPGGFSEYILRKRGKEGLIGSSSCSFCYGYGMSLIGENDDGCGLKWDLKTLSALAKNVSTPAANSATTNTSAINDGDIRWKVCYGEDGTGDMYNWDNVMKLQNDIRNDTYVKKDKIKHGNGDDNNDKNGKDNNKSKNETDTSTDVWKVDLVVADGGFDAQRDSECQESLAHPIVTCQIAASLVLLKKGGNFVIKMFGFQYSKRLMAHLYSSFETLMVLKPITSRPASAERYVVCLNYDGLDDDSSFDVLAWRDDIINSIGVNDTAPNTCDAMNSVLNNYLDEIDHNMLRLNIQACSAIISCLENNSEEKGAEETIVSSNDYSFYKSKFGITF